MVSRRARSRAAARRWLVGLVTALVLTASAGAIAVLVLSRTERGRAALADLGAPVPAAARPADVERRLREALPDLELAGEGVRCGMAGVADELTWWEWQERVARAVAGAGARVLDGERLPGDLLRLDVGVPPRTTHALLLYRRSRGRPAASWGDGAWARLVADRGRPTVALVIDDWGHGTEDDARELLELGAPLTLAVLPGLPYSARFAREATALALPAAGADVVPVLHLATAGDEGPSRRREVILHLPMEPIGYPDPDPGPIAVLTGMDRPAIRAVLDRALAGVPGVRGLNNHMGSAATADAPTMAALMAELRRRGLYFLDSQTTDRSVAHEEAARAGVPALRNRIFLDHDEPDAATVRARLASLVAEARARGGAVGIAHPHAVTAEVLAQEVPRLQAAGVRFVTLAELLALQAHGD